MYCSNDNGDDCSYIETLVRVGLPITQFFGLEKLFFNYGVDVEIWAHEHSYERLWPIYDYKVSRNYLRKSIQLDLHDFFFNLLLFDLTQVLNGSNEAPYTNPKGPVHIVCIFTLNIFRI